MDITAIRLKIVEIVYSEIKSVDSNIDICKSLENYIVGEQQQGLTSNTTKTKPAKKS